MITTKHREWDRRFRLLRQHGMSVSDTVRHSSNAVIFESYPEVGFNYRMTDIQAAVGREQLKKLSDVVARRRQLAAKYRELLSDIPGLVLPEEPEWARSNWQSFCVRLPDECDQRQTMQALLDRGIATRRGIMCAHRELAYTKETWRSAGPLAASEAAQETCIILPVYHELQAADQEYVASELHSAVLSACAA